MKLYIRQKMFTLKDRFTVKDQDQQDIFTVEGKFLSIGKKLTVFDPSGAQVIYLEQKVFSFLPKVDVYFDGQLVFTIKKKLTFLRQSYVLEGDTWTVEGDFWAHQYQVLDGPDVIARISKAFISWGDYYEVDIKSDQDVRKVLAIVLAIDIAMAAAQKTTSNATPSS